MRTLQPSFARGEISPLLHARVDLALYSTALSRLVNFIVLPQGGITRRPGFTRLGNSPSNASSRLVPFIYNREDSHIIEFYGGGLRVWRPATGTVVWSGASPYSSGEVRGLKYTQSGNWMFFAHKNYPVYRLVRDSLSDWVFEPFTVENGPWLAGSGKKSPEAYLNVVSNTNGIWSFRGSSQEFGGLRVGDMIRVDVTVGSEIHDTVPHNTTDYISEYVIVKGTWEFSTVGSYWAGKVYIEKSYDNGNSWYVVKTYEKLSDEDGNNVLMSGSETEDDVLYRVRVDMAADDAADLNYNFVSPPFVKSLSFRVTTAPVVSGGVASFTGTLLSDTHFVYYNVNGAAEDWGKGAWDAVNGYPAAVAFYQDRLSLAGSKTEQQTIWMSKVGDYKNFGTSDPLRDDDAITITLAADDSDGIHSLLSTQDLLAFTGSSEWRVKGAGDNGAIAPNAVVAHKQDNVGSAPMQPVLVHGQPAFIQLHRREVSVMNYSVEIDGYMGSNLSVMSSHLFEANEIRAFAYQQIPDSLLWFVLADGTAATCTYMAEHGVAAWARQGTDGTIGDVACIPGSGYTEAWFSVQRSGAWGIERLNDPRGGALTDAGDTYESLLETLRLNMDPQGGMLSMKKLISQVSLFARGIAPGPVRVSPASNPDRWRELAWESKSGMVEAEIMLDAGFERGAALRIWTFDDSPLTLLGVGPMFQPGA